MGRPVSFDFTTGGGSPEEFLMGVVYLEPTLMHTIGSTVVLPDAPYPVKLVNGKAVHPDVAVSPAGPEPAWAYRVTIKNELTGKSWSEFRGVPTGTTQIAYKDLTKFVTTIPPQTTAGMMQNWANTTEANADRSELAADRAEAPTDLMNKNLIENPASLTAGALSAAIGESVDFAKPSTRINVNELVADNAAAPLITPTYDGTGQTVHPDVVRIPGGFGPQGFEYWMGITPYPYSVDATENPSILASHDGQIWVVPNGMTNPVADPATGFWPDPDLTFDPATRRLYMVWLGHYVSWTDNGYQWTAPLQIVTGVAGTGEVSPAVVREGAGEYRMWSVRKVDGGVTNKILHRTGTSLESAWNPTATECTFTTPTGKEPWHIDVVKSGHMYFALIACCDAETSGANTILYLATSFDGFSWEFGRDPLIKGRPGMWDETNIYRATMLPSDGIGGSIADIWYSARASDASWHTGHTQLRRIDPAVELRAPLAAVAHHSEAVESQGSKRNLIANATMLVADSTGTKPDGTESFLSGATDVGWDSETASFKFTLADTVTRTLDWARLPVTAGLPYTFTFYGTSNVEGQRTQARLAFYDAGGALLAGAPAPVTMSTQVGRFLRTEINGTAPAGAVTATVRAAVLSSSGVPVQHKWRRAQFEQSARATEWTPGSALRVVAKAGQTSPLVEYLSPITAAGQTVLASILPSGAQQLPRISSAQRPPVATSEGVLFYDSTIDAVVYSNGVEWIPLGVISRRTKRLTVAEPLTALDTTVITNLVAAGTVRLPAVADATEGQVHEIKNVGVNVVTVAVRYDIGNIDGTASVTLSQWDSKRFIFSGGQWLTF